MNVYFKRKAFILYYTGANTHAVKDKNVIRCEYDSIFSTYD